MITFALLSALYFLPTLIAAHRGHRAVGIFLLNLLLGWTLIGWLVLLFHAMTLPARFYGAVPAVYPDDPRWRRF